ncbi:hypothetical protein D3C87_1575840 [compost metagenome]
MTLPIWCDGQLHQVFDQEKKPNDKRYIIEPLPRRGMGRECKVGDDQSKKKQREHCHRQIEPPLQPPNGAAPRRPMIRATIPAPWRTIWVTLHSNDPWRLPYLTARLWTMRVRKQTPLSGAEAGEIPSVISSQAPSPTVFPLPKRLSPFLNRANHNGSGPRGRPPHAQRWRSSHGG